MTDHNSSTQSNPERERLQAEVQRLRLFRRGAYIGVAIPVLIFLVVAVFSGVDFKSLFAAGQGTGAADVNARFWNGADWNDNLTLTGAVTLTNFSGTTTKLVGTTTDIVLSGTSTVGKAFDWLGTNGTKDCGGGNYVRKIAADGTVTCEADTDSDGDPTGDPLDSCSWTSCGKGKITCGAGKVAVGIQGSFGDCSSDGEHSLKCCDID